MSEAPVGQVTLVFTGVQASTVLWDRAPRAMKRALVQHDQVLRTGIQRFRGYEVKTEGDAFMVAFRSPLDAVLWCLESQMALYETDWPSEIDSKEAAEALYGSDDTEGFRGLRVRMGIHTGRPECRENHRGDTDYFGSEVNRAARLCDAGHGGQILMSTSVASALAGEDLGHQQALGDYVLRGLHEPERIIQILPHALSDRQFPPLRGVDEVMPDWPNSPQTSADSATGAPSSSWSEAPMVPPQGSRRLAVYCGQQFPLEGVRQLAVKHDLQLVRLQSLDDIQADDLLLVDGSEEMDVRLEGLRQLNPVWRHGFWVSFHEPKPPIPGVERVSPLDPVGAVEDTLFGSDKPPSVALVEPLEDPPWLEERRPDPQGFRVNKSAIAVVLIWAMIPAFCVLTAQPPLDVELPAVPIERDEETGESVQASVPKRLREARDRRDRHKDNTLGRDGKTKGSSRAGNSVPGGDKGHSGADNKEAAQRSPVTLFKTAYCPACRGVTCLLDRHKIPYKTLDLDEDEGAMEAFPKSLVEPDGSITVPVLQVGQERIQGYKRSKILETLDQAGYFVRNLRAERAEASYGTACKTFKKNELENWTRPRFSVLSPVATSKEDRRAKQPMPFDVGPMSACLKKLSKKGKKRLAQKKKLTVTLRMGIMGDGRIAAVSVKKLAFGTRRYKRRKVSSCIEGVVVGQTYPLRPEREPEFLTRTYEIP